MPRRLIGAKIGGFYLVMAGINIGLTIGDANRYQHFADGGLFPFVHCGWEEIVMAHPEPWIGLLAAGEIAIGLAFFGRGRWLQVAYLAAICFHVALMLFGWGVWVWAVPALALLTLSCRHDHDVQTRPSGA